MATRSQANRIAAAAALLVFLVIALVVDREGEFTEPQTTTVVKREVESGAPVEKITTRVTFAGGRQIGSTRTSEIQPQPSPPAQTVRTTETEPPTGIERVLGDEILTFLLALLAAFLTAAALQRILLGRYGGTRSAASEELEKLDRDIKLELARIHALLAQLETKMNQARGIAGDGQAEQVSEAQVHAERLAREAFALEGRG
jgi:hypothetical protein